MPNSPARRLPILLALAIAVAAGGFSAWHYAVLSVKNRIEQALGPRGEVREINVGPRGIEILDLRIRAPENAAWPSEDELRARRIRIVPDIPDLLTARLSIDSIRIEGAYVVLLRTRTGEMKFLPGLLDRQSEQPPSDTKGAEEKGNGAGKTPLDIGQIVVSDGIVDFYDASIRRTPLRLRLEQVEATVGKLRLPDPAGHTNLKIDGVFKGDRQDGKLTIEGSIDPAAKESRLTTRLRNVDMTTLQPYLIRTTEAGVRRGALDLDLKSSVAGGKLRAPGTLTLSGLELTSGSATFMGLPRNVALDLLKDKKGRISMKFVLEGDIDDPRFSLNEQMAVRLGSSLAGVQGVNLESLIKDVGNIGGGSGKAIGESVGRLLGKRHGGGR